MKKVFLAVVVFLMIASVAWGTGSCVPSSSETVDVTGAKQRKYITLTCTSDDGGIAAYSFSPTTYGVKGWYLYNVTTTPSATSVPTNLYDITCLVSGEDICGGLLADRSSTLSQTVLIAPPVRGYPVLDESVIFTFAGITSNPGIFTLKIRLTDR